jgi:hypothetical protein
VQDLKDRHLSSFDESIGNLDFRLAAFHATQLQTIDHFNKDYAFLAEKTSLLRDVLLRPTSYKTIEGLARTEGQLKKLLDPRDSKPRDNDIETAFVLVLWQARRDKFTQYLAANACAHILENDKKARASDPETRFALAPVALHYLNAYMASPLSDRELEILQSDSNMAQKDTESDAYSKLFPLQPTSKLTAALADAKQDPRNATTLESPIYSSIGYGSITAKMYPRAVSTYYAMINLQAQAAAEGDAAQAKVLIEKRNELARSLVSVWEEWFTAMASASIDLSFSNRLAILQGLHATYARAATYASSNTAEIAKPSLPEAKLFHTKWLDASVRGFVRPQGFRVMQGLASKAFIEDEAKLISFENAMIDAKRAIKANSGEASPKARSASLLAAELGIFGCRSESFVCLDGNSIPVNAIWLIREQIPQELRPEDVGWKEILKVSVHRTVPIP